MLQTRKSNPNKPPRVLIYGQEGVGKSNFGAKADAPVFISPEGGTDQLVSASGAPIDVLPAATSWDELRTAVKEVLVQPHDFRTLVLDSADWAEKLCHAKIIGNSKKSIVTVDGGYGTGYRTAEILHRELIEDLSLIREKRGMAIIVTAHFHVRAVKDPESSHDYDAFEVKCHEQVSSLWREWVDAQLFVRFRTFTKESESTERARALTDDTRVMYAVKSPGFQAKNRYGMPKEMNFDKDTCWKDFMGYARCGVKPESASEIEDEIMELSKSVTDDAIVKSIADTTFKAEGNVERLIQIRARVKTLTNKGAA